MGKPKAVWRNMGYMSAYDLASQPEELSYEKAVEIHLMSNHYPPVSADFVPACIQAIKSFVIAAMSVDSQGEEEVYSQLQRTMLETPVGMRSAAELVEALHLDAFIDYELHKHGI